MAYPRDEISKHFIGNKNIGIVIMRKLVNTQELSSVLLTNTPIDLNFYGFQTYFFPLYLYTSTNEQKFIGQEPKRVSNFNIEIVKQIADKLNLPFINDNEPVKKNTFAPIDILDYIYSVLYSTNYRNKYKDFLKKEFPRIPYPKNIEIFWQLVRLGAELRQIHLLESPVVDKFITQYPIEGDNIITKLKRQNNKVYINKTQYFDNVPEIAWQFYIGGYQPAQKWLKDRKEKELSYEDIRHYQKIIVALTETDRLMKEIDKIHFI